MRQAFLTLLFAAAACTDPAGLSGRYTGSVAQADFLRLGFAPATTLELTLDIPAAAPGSAAGALSTSDGRFDAAPLGPLGAAALDTLGEASLPGAGPLTLMLAAPTAAGEEALVVVTLGASGGEARIAYGRAGQPNALYGVFPLARAAE